jgi:hypothetical protein
MDLKTLLFLVFIGFYSNRILLGESEAEFRANARILQERIDAENARIEKEAERIYHERKYGAHSSSAEPEINALANKPKSDFSWEDAGEQIIVTVSVFAGLVVLAVIIFIIFVIIGTLLEGDTGGDETRAEDTGGLNRYTWESLTIYKRIFYQNQKRIAVELNIKEYYSLVVEYNLCSCDKRRLEICAVFAERNWGNPFLKRFKRRPFRDAKAESNRKRNERIKLLVLPCPECFTDIDCNDAEEEIVYSCHRCSINYRFRDDVGLIAS